MTNYTLLGVNFQQMSEADAHKRIISLLDRNGACVFTPNAVILGKAARAPSLRGLLSSADLLLPDGVSIGLACRIMGLPPQKRITGIDTAYWLMEYARRHGLSVYLLGGAHGIAKQAARHLRAAMPELDICGAHHGYFDKHPNSEENKEVIKDINKASPDILFVCMGFPTQEAWIRSNISKLPSVHLAMGLGGSLDVWSGKTKRAPRLLQDMGLEWLWRSITSPKKLLDLASLPLFYFELKASK